MQRLIKSLDKCRWSGLTNAKLTTYPLDKRVLGSVTISYLTKYRPKLYILTDRYTWNKMKISAVKETINSKSIVFWGK